MNRIDFLGAPGVGKTALYDELVKQRTRRDRWLTPIEAKIEIAKKKCLLENFGNNLTLPLTRNKFVLSDVCIDKNAKKTKN